MRGLVAAVVVLGALWLPPGAQAAIADVFGGDVACSLQGDNDRVCGDASPRSTSASWDGVPIDVNVAFPADDGVGPDGDYPLIMIFHGWGEGKLGFASMEPYLDRGYAVFSMSDRGFHESCGTPASQTAGGAACDDGYVRLLDGRYEARDAQFFAGRLVDQDAGGGSGEGLISPTRIGALGGSYGGGMSMALAALRDRTWLPDGTLVPWTSPADGTAMRLAAAAPNAPWTDLAYSLAPNGGTLDYAGDARYTGRFGVMKQSVAEGLYLAGQIVGEGYYSAPGSDSDADVTGWQNRLRAGEPYDGDPYVAEMLDEITSHHSSYYIDHSQPPAPLLISSGFTDDVFPADEALRFYNRTRDQHPGTPISLFLGNIGHQRAQNRGADGSLWAARRDAWLDHYIKGVGPTPFQGAEAMTQVCPGASPSGGPVSAPNWALIAPGEVRYSEAAAKTIVPGSGSTALGVSFDPVAAGTDPCDTSSAADQTGVATYRLPAAKSAYTLMGAVTVIADINSPVADSELAARLLDVGPDGRQTLINRGLYRPEVGSSRQVFQLHPNGWKFEQGHVPKLELLPRDTGTSALNSYARASNNQGSVVVSHLELRLPVLEKPGAKDGYVKAPATKLLPPGQELAGDFAALPRSNAKLREGKLKIGKRGASLSSPEAWAMCHAKVELLPAGGREASSKKKGGKRVVLARGKVKIRGGSKGAAKLRLTKKGSAKLRGKRRVKVRVEVRTTEQKGAVVKAKRVLLLP